MRINKKKFNIRNDHQINVVKPKLVDKEMTEKILKELTENNL